ncbi:MAG: HAMP domain-containing histidine kinase [Nitrospirota bacterium]|nr:HAMP domain-containing histidine kinase [Nitrospirota bacterium]
MGDEPHNEFSETDRRTFLTAGLGRLPPAWREALEALPARVVPLAPGQVPALPDATVLVVVTDQAGLGDLQTQVEQAPGHQVAALYSGNRPSVAALCAQMGAQHVICLNELNTDRIGTVLGMLPEAAPPPAAAAWPGRVLEALPVGAALRDRNGNYLYRNPVHRKVRRDLLRTLTPETMGPLQMTELADPESGHVWLCSRVALHGGAGGTCLEVMEDVTGRHNDQDALTRQRDTLAQHARAVEAANRELARLDDAKSDFIALAAHELRTPLTAIRNALHLLRIEQGEETGPARTFLDMAERNALRLGSLADHLLDYTKLDTRQAALTAEPLDMAELARQAALSVKADAEHGRVRLHLQLPTGLPSVHGDGTRLGPLVTTLIESAVRHSPQGGVVRLAARHLTRWSESAPMTPPDLPEAAGGWVEMSITFSGAEVSPEQAAALFDPFAPGDKGLGWESGRFGLELAVCRKIVAAHGGAVWAQPRAKRIRFVVRLPRLTPDALGLLGLRDGLKRLTREQSDPRLAVVTAPDARTASRITDMLRDQARPGWQWAPTTSPHGGVLLVPGGEAAQRAAETLLSCGSSNRNKNPIRIGWSLPGAGEGFASVLERARAARRDAAPCPDADA